MIIEAILDAPGTTIFMSVITIFVLFSDDARMLVATVHHDDAFYATSAFCMGIFTIEIMLSIYSKPGYINSFYFYLDIISTVFMIADIGWAWDIITNTQSSQGNQVSQVKNASQTSKTATRGVRIIRIVRLVRLIRLVKLYKNAQIALKRRSQKATVTPEDALFPQESKIGKRLSELTTMRVILLVLVLLVLLPLFELDLYYDSPTSGEFSLTQLSKYYGSPGFQVCLDEILSYKVVSLRPLILLSYGFETYAAIYTSGTPINDLRVDEKYYAANGDFVAIYDIRVDTQLEAGLSICRTVFVSIVMTLAALYFTRDAQKLVIEPIEKMMRKVAKIAKDPIHATEEKMVDVFEEDPTETPQKTCFCCKKETELQHFETQLLEDTLLKISTLLGLGFGEAGAKMIGQNLAKNQDLDLMLDGARVIGIFGFCDIRNFTDTTEVLREDVMLFVNQIANIVHTTVATCLGTANKNIGDAFLLVWKFDQQDVQLRGSSISLDEKSLRVMHLCDLSLISFLKIIVKISTHSNIVAYRKHPGLLNRMPGYTVKMGFGLHLGWAIEGAIGSDLKIDASYLSPHVNMSSRLEAATKQYGVPLLLSGSLVKYMSPKVQPLCRHIDTVTVKGSNEPEELYTSDIDTADLSSKRDEHTDKAIAIQKRRDLEKRIGDSDFDATTLINRSKGLQKLRMLITPEFLDAFGRGVKGYLSGDWQEAQKQLMKALELRNDGPSHTLLGVMEEYDFRAPKEWPGYRALTEK